MKPPFLNSFRVRNFKAIGNSGSVRLTPLTVFIGNNGSGKSSLNEALETFRAFVVHDLDAPMQMWRGIEHVRNKAAGRQTRFSKRGTEYFSKPIELTIRGHNGRVSFASTILLNERRNENEISVQKKTLRAGQMRGVDRYHAIQIATSLPELNQLRRVSTFARFADRLEIWARR